MTESEARAALEAILDGLGVRAGDRIMLGIDMGRVPLPEYHAPLTLEALRDRERRWCQFVLDVLLDRLGTAGTLLVPSYTYSCGKPGSVFVAESTPSEVGPFTEFFRARPRTARSLHPIFSLSGVGRDAGALLGGSGRSAFGAMSPFARFAPYGVRLLCLGVELRHSITYAHHLEQSYGCPHRYHKSFDTRVLANAILVPGDWYAYVSYRELNYESDFSRLQDALAAAGALMEFNGDGRSNHLADVAAVDRVGYELLAADPSAFINRPSTFRFDESASESLDRVKTSTLTITATQVASSV